MKCQPARHGDVFCLKELLMIQVIHKSWAEAQQDLSGARWGQNSCKWAPAQSLSSRPLLCGFSPRMGSLGLQILNILSCPGSSSIAKTSEILHCVKLWCRKAGKTSTAYARCKGLSPPTPMLSIPPPWAPRILFFPSHCSSFPLPDHHPALVISLLSVTPCQECFFIHCKQTWSWGQGSHLPSHQHRVNEKGDKWHANAFPGGYREVTSFHLSEECICMLSDTDILLDFLRVCELQRHLFGDLHYVGWRLLGGEKEKRSWLRKEGLTQLVEKYPSMWERQGNNLASALR